MKKLIIALGILTAIFLQSWTTPEASAQTSRCNISYPGQWYNPTCPRRVVEKQCYRPGTVCRSIGGKSFTCNGGGVYSVVSVGVNAVAENATFVSYYAPQKKRTYTVPVGQPFTIRYFTEPNVTSVGVIKARSLGMTPDICYPPAVKSCPPEGCVLGTYQFNSAKGVLHIIFDAKKPHPKAPVNMYGTARIYISATAGSANSTPPPSDVPTVTFDGPSQVTIGQRFQVRARTSGNNITRLSSSGWTGPIGPKPWLGGSQLPADGVDWGGDLHMSGTGTASVTLTVTNGAGVSRNYTYSVTGRDYANNPTCKIVGPTRVAAGQRFYVQWQNTKPGVTTRIHSLGWSGAIQPIQYLGEGDINKSGGSWGSVANPALYSDRSGARPGVVLEAYSSTGQKSICTYHVNVD